MDIAILLTAIASLLTSFITMFTVREMRKQRVVSHMPIIKILGGYVQIKIGKNQNWDWNNETLQLGNFGKGVALDVKIKWEVPVDEVITMLKKYDPYNVKEYSLNNNLLKLDNSAHNIKLQSEKFFPAITETLDSSNNSSSNIVIPYYLTTAFGKYINEAIINRPESSNNEASVKDFPEAGVKVSYIDINNNLHEKNFSLSIGMSAMQRTPGGEAEAYITFDVQEKSA